VVLAAISPFAQARPDVGVPQQQLSPEVVSRALAQAGLTSDAMDPAQDEPFGAGSTGLGLLSACKADFNADTFLSFDDFDAYVNAYERGEPSADFNGDGFLTAEDFSAFVEAFDAGCKVPVDAPLFPGPIYSIGWTSESIAIGDLNGDGCLDIASNTSQYVGVLLNLGNGTFGAKSEYWTQTTQGAIAIGDLDGDGMPDLAVIGAGDSEVKVLRNLGNGTFAGVRRYYVQSGVRGLSIEDVTGDGLPDLVVANTGFNRVTVLRNLPTGPGKINFSFEAHLDAGFNPWAVAVRDLDDDGRSDIVVTNRALAPNTGNTVTVLRNTSEGGVVRFAGKVSFLTGFGPRSIAIADLDGDSRPDLAVANQDSGSVSVLRNLGNCTFGPRTDYPTAQSPLSIAVADLNGDGRPDLATACRSANAASVLLNAGNGVFATRRDFLADSSPSSIAIGDLDGDGRFDIAMINGGGRVSTFRNLGNGEFLTRAAFSVGSGPRTVAMGDVDGDGRPDLAIVNRLSNSVSVLRNLGNRSFAEKIDYPAGPSPQSVALGDLDGDGRPDIAVANQDNNTVSVLRNSGDGTFTPGGTFKTGSYPSFVAIGDLDGDGFADLAVANVYSFSVSVLRNLGNGSFAPKVDFDVNAGPQHLVIADLDGDGRLDLAVANSGFSPSFQNTVSILRNTSSTASLSFAPKVDFVTGVNPVSVAIGDLDGDGRPDLAVAAKNAKVVSVLRNTSSIGTLGFASRVDYVTASEPLSVAIGDVTGDGRQDLVSSRVTVWRNLGDGILAAPLDYLAGGGPDSIAIGDLDADGWADLAVTTVDSSDSPGFVTVLTNQKFDNRP